jgi:hypothetical protein
MHGRPLYSSPLSQSPTTADINETTVNGSASPSRITPDKMCYIIYTLISYVFHRF